MRALASMVALARQSAVDQIIRDPAAAPGLTPNLCEATSPNACARRPNPGRASTTDLIRRARVGTLANITMIAIWQQ